MFKKSTVSLCLAMLLSAPLANACVVDVKAVTFPDIYSKADRVLLASGADIYDLRSCTKIGGAKHIDLDSFFKHEGAIYRADFLSEDARYVLQTGEDLSGNMLVNVLSNPDWSVLNELIAILSLSKPWTPDFEKRYREIKNAYEFENIMPRVNLNASGKRNAAYLIDRFDHVMQVLNGSQNVLLGEYLFREGGAVYSSSGDLAKALHGKYQKKRLAEATSTKQLKLLIEDLGKSDFYGIKKAAEKKMEIVLRKEKDAISRKLQALLDEVKQDELAAKKQVVSSTASYGNKRKSDADVDEYLSCRNEGREFLCNFKGGVYSVRRDYNDTHYELLVTLSSSNGGFASNSSRDINGYWLYTGCRGGGIDMRGGFHDVAREIVRSCQ